MLVGWVLFVLVVGFLEVRAQAVQSGVIIDWTNHLEAVSKPAGVTLWVWFRAGGLSPAADGGRTA